MAVEEGIKSLGGICDDICIAAEGIKSLLENQQSTFFAKLRELIENSGADEDFEAAVVEETSRTAEERELQRIVKISGRKIMKLEESEKKVFTEFNQVMSNLYMSAGCNLAVSTGVSGSLSSDPRDCRMLIMITPVALSFLAGMFLAIYFAHQQLQVLKRKRQELCTQRSGLHRRFNEFKRQYTRITEGPDLVMNKMVAFEEVNADLKFQAHYYDKYVWLVGVCGVLYAGLLLIAGYHVVCSQASSDLQGEPPVPDHFRYDSYLKEW